MQLLLTYAAEGVALFTVVYAAIGFCLSAQAVEARKALKTTTDSDLEAVPVKLEEKAAKASLSAPAELKPVSQSLTEVLTIETGAKVNRRSRRAQAKTLRPALIAATG